MHVRNGLGRLQFSPSLAIAHPDDATLPLFASILPAKQGTIPFENFPEDMQAKLRLLDDTGDGQLDAQEILAGIEALQREKDKAAMLKKAVIGLSALIFMLLILIGLVMGESGDSLEVDSIDPVYTPLSLFVNLICKSVLTQS